MYVGFFKQKLILNRRDSKFNQISLKGLEGDDYEIKLKELTIQFVNINQYTQHQV